MQEAAAPEPFEEHTWEDSIPAYQSYQSNSALQATYSTADDVHFTLLVQEPDSLAALAAVTQFLEIPLTAARRAPAQGLIEQLATGFRGKDWTEVSCRLRADGVEHTRVLSPDELMKDVIPPEVVSSGLFVEIPGVDDTRGFVNTPFECHSSPLHGYRRRAPMAGVHTSAYLKLGWSERAVEVSLPPVEHVSSGGPLRGVTVLELSVGTSMAVSVACLRLASLGARVIQLRSKDAPKALAQFNRGGTPLPSRSPIFSQSLSLPTPDLLMLHVAHGDR
jgi:crotonobetainyl-CoA:carnitine CoA-transferase CaiB-like acyl-CoA transferase